jgi:hypothetical protein
MLRKAFLNGRCSEEHVSEYKTKLCERSLAMTHHATLGFHDPSITTTSTRSAALHWDVLHNKLPVFDPKDGEKAPPCRFAPPSLPASTVSTITEHHTREFAIMR